MSFPNFFNRRKKRKVFVIGLDCATPQLIFDKWRADLPTLNKLTRTGVYGKLKSVDPPITSPAWSCMLTGKSPGDLGVYGFRHRKVGTYDEKYFAFSDKITSPRVWDILGQNDRKVVCLGIPQTFPVGKVNGYLISSFLTPSTDSDYTWPRELKEDLDRVCRFNGQYSKDNKGYMLDVENFRTPNKDRVLNEIYQMTEKRLRATQHMLQKKWDFFMSVFMGPDRIHHGFWKYMDKDHRQFQSGNKYEDAIFEYYKYLDNGLGELIGKLDDNTTIIVVSDHGAKKLDGCISINEWLRREGYLSLNHYPEEPERLKEDWIDWDNTLAWGWGGYYGRIFVNVKGREPNGQLAPEDYEQFRDELARKLEKLPGDDGKQIGTKVYKPENLYSELNGDPPDLLVYFGDLNWRSSSSLGIDSIYLSRNDTGPDHANHARNGIIIAAGDGVTGRGEMNTVNIQAVAPTILNLMDEKIPSEINVGPIEL